MNSRNGTYTFSVIALKLVSAWLLSLWILSSDEVRG